MCRVTLFLLFVVSFLHSSIKAQSIDELRIKRDFAGCSLDWMSREGRTYFIQQSEDLSSWTFAPVIKSGDGSMLSAGFQCNLPSMFVRLNWTDVSDGGDARTADFDNDGLGSLEEIQASPQTNPLLPDSDGDGLLDGWEVAYHLNPTSADSNNDGILDAQEDPDQDGSVNLTEQRYSGNPNDASDGGHIKQGRIRLIRINLRVSSC